MGWKFTCNIRSKAAQTIQTAISYSVQSGAIDPGNEVIVTVTYSYAEAGKIVVSILEMDGNDEKVETRFSNSVDISAGSKSNSKYTCSHTFRCHLNILILPRGHKYIIDVAMNDSNDNFLWLGVDRIWGLH